MGLIDQPTLWEPSPWVNSNPPDAIDYRRPREGFFMSTTPTSISSGVSALEDVNDGWLGDAWNAIKEYTGLGDDKDKSTSKEMEDETEDETEDITTEDIKPSEPNKKELQNSELISLFQSFFSKSHPVIGQLYHGPKDGKMNVQLQTAAEAAEAKIASIIKDDKVKGMILSGKKFVTNPSDVLGAINVIIQHNNTISSFLPRNERITVLSSIISSII